jgi:hypothetical protein
VVDTEFSKPVEERYSSRRADEYSPRCERDPAEQGHTEAYRVRVYSGRGCCELLGRSDEDFAQLVTSGQSEFGEGCVEMALDRPHGD